MKITIRVACILCISLLFLSCATVNQAIMLAPVNTEFPVSATRSIYDGGKIIREEEMKESVPFSVSEVFEVRKDAKSEQLDLTELLNKQVENTQSNGISQLSMSIDKVDNSILSWLMLERYSSLCIVLCGAGVAVIESISGDDANYGLPIVIASTGAALFGGSLIHGYFGKIKYTVNINGVCVKY